MLKKEKERQMYCKRIKEKRNCIRPRKESERHTRRKKDNMKL
jgi:hypothetical protein